MAKDSQGGRQRAAKEAVQAGKSVSARRWLLTAGAAVAIAAFGLGGYFQYRSGESKPSAATFSLPAPESSGMTAPVARAVREARRAALARPNSGPAVGAYCQVLHAHWLYDAAADCYAIARDLSPDDFRWAYLLAGVEELRNAGEDRVERLYQEAIRLSPAYPPAYVRYADSLLRFGRWPAARDSYAMAIELDPDLVLARRGLGQALTLLGDGPAAVEQLERAAELSPGDRITQSSLARAYALAGNGELAADAALREQSLNSTASLPDPVYFEMENRAVDPENLRKRFARSVQKGDRESAIGAAKLLEESGAPAALQQLVNADKQRAMQYAMAGDFDRALAEFERAATLAPADPEIQHNWGTVLLRQGALQEAQLHFEKAIELNPQSADSLYNLGVVLEGLGRADQARARFTQAAAIDPNHAAARRLTELERESGR